jgi:hypothetical protein
VKVLVPVTRGADPTDQLTSRALPDIVAMPLPPWSLTQVTRATLRSSLAVPLIPTAPAVVLSVVPVRGLSTVSSGAALSSRASAASRSAAFGSTSLLLPPQPARATHTAAMGVSRGPNFERAIIFRALGPGYRFDSSPTHGARLRGGRRIRRLRMTPVSEPVTA